MKRPEFDAAKAAGELDASGGKVPLLTIDGKEQVGQSKAVERYLAKALNLAGSSDVQAAQCDQVGETVRDIKDAYQKAKTEEAVLRRVQRCGSPVQHLERIQRGVLWPPAVERGGDLRRRRGP